MTRPISVTRFGEISPLCQTFKSLWVIFLDVLFSIWQTFVPTLAFYAIGQIVIAVNGQRLNNSIAIWSHCVLYNWMKILKVENILLATGLLLNGISYS